ncbi:cobalt ECF transporter T component CbiQ [Methanofollis tationis]|uniref:Cobalt ECF transporter T component CbiQ n=1 Tax=Methanofollis tationis TaxID=81417 RepID=A0A7K4HQJ5_9EURY|nr:cobalt ECF transporter T component CbiQ [Methanofollis tationis]NVO67545.1 cobalt ECF transporter T component CbiQ [Methanofollis tationis]
MIEDLFAIEQSAQGTSPVHRCDARVKLLITLAVIITVVAFPYTTAVYRLGAAILLFFAALWTASGLSPTIYLKRFLLILPFGFFLIFFQIFFENPHYTAFHPLFALPLGIAVYAESVEFASILAVKFLACISFIILLSSTTTMQGMLEGAGRLGMPPEFTLVLGMMVRYLFLFARIYLRVKASLETRCFDAFDRSLPYRYRLQTLAYTIGTIFLRSFEQGERTYTSMRCRGYGKDSHLFIRKKPLLMSEWVFLATSLTLVPAAAVTAWLL